MSDMAAAGGGTRPLPRVVTSSHSHVHAELHNSNALGALLSLKLRIV